MVLNVSKLEVIMEITKKKSIELKFYNEHGREALNSIKYLAFEYPYKYLSNKDKDHLKNGKSVYYYTKYIDDIKTPTNKYDYYRLVIGTICMGNWLGFDPTYKDLSSYHDMNIDENIITWSVLKDIKDVCNEFWVVNMLGGNPNEILDKDYPFIHDWVVGITNHIKPKFNDLSLENPKRKVYENLLKECRKDMFKNIETVRHGKSNIIDIQEEIEYWRTRVDFEI